MKLKTLLLSVTLLAAPAAAQKYVGGDISLLPTNEQAGATYLDNAGNAISSPLRFFKDEGMNAMRVRLFVNPEKYTGTDKDANACQDIEYVKALGKRIKDEGMKLMLDFHYSDTWADPAKQWTPAEWASLSDEELYQKIYDYTKDALQQMKDAGAEPDLIQTGNEISYGMLWGAYGSTSLKKCYMGSSANWSRFTTLLKNAGKACREVCPNAKIILHTERAAQPNVLTNFYDQMKSAEVDYDIIGLSYYPIWHKNIATLETAITTLENRYADKSIMIVETGYAYSWYPGDYDYNYQSTYPATEEGQDNFTKDLVTMLKKHSKVTGLFWWWMEYNAYPWETTRMDNWWYAPLFNGNTGKCMKAFYSMIDFIDDGTSISSIRQEAGDSDDAWTNLRGERMTQPRAAGIYVHGNKKILVK